MIKFLIDKEISLQININRTHHETLSPYTQKESLILASSSLYQFTFTSPTHQQTISFKPEIFQDDGAQWLPLKDSDFLLSELLEETQAPRFLIVLFKAKSLQVIRENSEENSFAVTDPDDLMPEIKLLTGLAEKSEFLTASSIKALEGFQRLKKKLSNQGHTQGN
jgi:hypothetical protein